MRICIAALLCVAGCLSGGHDTAKVRNPMSGQCEASNSSNADWPSCESACTNLDQPACMSSSSCHMAANVESGETGIYGGCWALSSATRANGTCKTLDAAACATRDDCVTNFELGANAGAYMDCVDKTLYAP